MKNTLTILKKELLIYFTSPIAYVVIAVFILIMGFLFYTIVEDATRRSAQMMQMQGALPPINLNNFIFRPVFGNMSVILMLTLPLLTMRLISEEKKNKTFELLMTSPVSLSAIILGKFLAAMTVFTLMLALTGYMPMIMGYYGSIHWMPILAGYLGIWIIGGVFISVGLFASSLTENQIISSILSFGIILLLWLIGWMALSLSDSFMGPLLTYISIGEHSQNFIKGILDTRDLAYLGSLIIFGLFLTHRVLESHYWK